MQTFEENIICKHLRFSIIIYEQQLFVRLKDIVEDIPVDQQVIDKQLLYTPSMDHSNRRTLYTCHCLLHTRQCRCTTKQTNCERTLRAAVGLAQSVLWRHGSCCLLKG